MSRSGWALRRLFKFPLSIVVQGGHDVLDRLHISQGI